MTKEIGKINMTNPAGYKTSISVTRRNDGNVDLHFSRSSQGEVLVRLPPFAAKRLGKMLDQATDQSP